MKLKRAFDIITSFTTLILLLPVFLVISILVKLSSKGPVLFKQPRIGKNKIEFIIFKFRTMPLGSDSVKITFGNNDPRITKIGYYLRKYRLDELPQLINIVLGDMSVIGPRPEVKEYVDLYTQEQLKVLTMRPGLSDLATLEFLDEGVILANSNNPIETYIHEIIPKKLSLAIKYIENQSFLLDMKIIVRTLKKLLF